MTLAVERAVQWRSDRRGRSAGPRRSWASSQPVELRAVTAAGVPPAHGWGRVSVTYQRRAIALDALVAAVVGAALMVPLYGFAPGTAGLVLVGVVGFIALVAVSRGYEPRSIGDGPAEYQALLRAGAIGAMLVISLSYLSRVDVSRLLVLGGVPLLVGAAIVVRHVHRRLLHRQRAEGRAMMRTLIVGNSADVSRVVQDLSGSPHHGYQVIGMCLPSLDDAAPRNVEPVFGALADTPQVAADHAVDVVVVAGSALSGEALRRLSWALDRVGVQLVVVPDLIEVAAPRLTVRPTAGLSLLEVEIGTPRRRMIAKAALDRVVGVALLAAAAPLILAAAIAVRATSTGPAFYRQTRVGIDGRTFTMWKLRTMVADAEEIRPELEVHSQGAGVLFKLRQDPRVTPVGRVLRRFSIDEVPQLLNVITGTMSLVGPRPPLADEVARYPDAVHRRLRVKPGLTGLWQVSGRSDLDWDESVRLDLRYVDNWSVAMDLVIMWKTLRAVLAGAGAY